MEAKKLRKGVALSIGPESDMLSVQDFLERPPSVSRAPFKKSRSKPTSRLAEIQLLEENNFKHQASLWLLWL